MSNIILGTELMLFVKDSSGKTKALGASTACKLTLNANTLETSSKDSGKWTSNQPAKLSWSCSSDNLFTIANYAELMEKCINREKINVMFTTAHDFNNKDGVGDGWEISTSTDTNYMAAWEGEAIITSIDMNAPDGDNATYSISMTGSGALKKAE